MMCYGVTMMQIRCNNGVIWYHRKMNNHGIINTISQTWYCWHNESERDMWLNNNERDSSLSSMTHQRDSFYSRKCNKWVHIVKLQHPQRVHLTWSSRRPVDLPVGLPCPCHCCPGCSGHAAGHLTHGSPARLSCSGFLSSRPPLMLSCPSYPHSSSFQLSPGPASSARIRDASRGLVGGPFMFSTCF